MKDSMASSTFETRVKTDNGQSLASGLFVDFNEVVDKESLILRCLKDLQLHGPFIIMDLAPMRDLEANINGVDWSDSMETLEEKLDKKPPCARIVLPVSQIIDLKNINPPIGSSIIRCNASVPIYAWFQAANLLLMKQPGRLIPFPMEQENGDITYQSMRVTQTEFLAYQDLLEHCVTQDGPEQGFMIAAKYAYQILLNRGITDLTYKQVGSMITDIVIMGNSVMRGLLIANSNTEDFEDIRRLGIYI
jgi:hypothetical protein